MNSDNLRMCIPKENLKELYKKATILVFRRHFPKVLATPKGELRDPPGDRDPQFEKH